MQMSYGLPEPTAVLSVTVRDEITMLGTLNRPATLHYDAYGRLVTRENKLAGASIFTDYRYDCLGRLTNLFDPADNQWIYTYDSFGRRLTMNDPDQRGILDRGLRGRSSAETHSGPDLFKDTIVPFLFQ